MIETKREEAKAEVLKAIKNSIGDAKQIINELIRAFEDNVKILRAEQNAYVFNNFVQNIRDLQCVFEYIGELNAGIRYLDQQGIRPDPISSKNFGIDILKEINGAFTSCDWVLLADLIEYELIPLLSEEAVWIDEIESVFNP
jgi:hypothetical protein